MATLGNHKCDSDNTDVSFFSSGDYATTMGYNVGDVIGFELDKVAFVIKNENDIIVTANW